MLDQIAAAELIACATAAMLIALWGLILMLRAALGYLAVPAWIRWPLVTIAGVLIAQILFSITAANATAVDLAFPGTISLLTLGAVMAAARGIRRMTALRRRRMVSIAPT
jgi:hypothetical protein